MDDPLDLPRLLHHSYSDWYFLGSNWPRYDTTHVLSSPTSLQAQRVTTVIFQGHSILATHPRLPELQVINNINFHHDGSAMHADYFRAQDYPIGPVYEPANCYHMSFYPSRIRFGYFINGGYNQIAYVNIVPALALDTWHKYRWAAWDLPSHAVPLTLAYFFDLWQTDHWTRLLSGTSPAQLWSQMTINRFGIWLNAGGHYNQRGVTIDDTQIWVPAV